MAAYAEAKKKFFDTLSVEACAYLNFDDPYHAYMSSDTSATVHTFGKLEDASDRLCDLQVTDDGVSFRLHDEEFSSRLYGEFNAFNIAAAALALSTEFPLRVLACHTSSLTPIAGRLQRINSTGSVRAFVDFAHTPDALEKVLTALQPMLAPEGRLITVLGCGGDKDKEKRPVMAALATKHSDHVIITSDNPRSEDPASIIDEMVEGIGPAVAASWLSEPDRRRAIERAVEWARPGDLILVAGKGHEKFQEIAGEKYPFDDVAILERTLRRSTQVGAT
jgi:UDP-N-acetylmuramoyl-L-alanyl-D-glutamate--2,6-diaminopimelate ligase